MKKFFKFSLILLLALMNFSCKSVSESLPTGLVKGFWTIVVAIIIISVIAFWINNEEAIINGFVTIVGIIFVLGIAYNIVNGSKDDKKDTSSKYEINFTREGISSSVQRERHKHINPKITH